MSKVIRVFPRKTNATPDDILVRLGTPELFDEADEVHISVAFTYDLKKAEQLEYQWRHVAPTRIGGPATGERGEEFIAGRYIKHGYTITSRGCPNHCWFCSVPKREGDLRELPIVDGWNILDDNLLACSREHIEAVFAMLKRQKRKAEFTGGIEAKRLEDWHVPLFVDLKPRQIFFAYDTADDWLPLKRAAEMMRSAGFNHNALRCFVLCGYPKDTIERAEKRMEQVWSVGVMPMAMLWRDFDGGTIREWRRWARTKARPAMMNRRVAEVNQRLAQ